MAVSGSGLILSPLPGFSSDCKIHRLVYFEQHAWIQDAIAREKQLKRGRREKKVWLIERENPTWEDLAADWGKPVKLKLTHPAAANQQQVPPRGLKPLVGMTHR